MRSLVFNFIKRFLLVPAVITAIAIVVLVPYLNKNADASQNILKQSTSAAPDLSAYSSSAYESFSELNEGDFVGTLSGQEFGLNETAVCYEPGSNAQLSLKESSTAPWDGGAILLVGLDTANQLRAMHRAVIGSELELNLAGKDIYRYTINRVDAGVTNEQLSTYYTNGTLAVAMPYKNLSGVTAEDYYLVFSAVQQ